MNEDMNERMRKRARESWSYTGSPSTRLIIGLFVVVFGILYLVSNLHIFDLPSPRRYFWPAVFLAIGFALVIEHRSERSWQWGIGWIIVGLWTFAERAGWVDFGFWELVVPVLMLLGGAYLVRHALLERRDQDTGPHTIEGSSTSSSTNTSSDTTSSSGASSSFGTRNSGPAVHGIGVLSASEQKPTHAISRGELFALMGGVKLDLMDTQLIDNKATIHVAACMGGVEIIAPSEWIVQSRVLPLMGAFVDKRRPAAIIPVPEQAKTLIIDGFVLMGGIEIKN